MPGLAVALIIRVYRALVNGRTPIGLVLNFARNFSLIFVWLLTFKNAGLIPTEWRPSINVRILNVMDSWLFTGLTGVLFGTFLAFVHFHVAVWLSHQDNRPLLGSLQMQHVGLNDKYDDNSVAELGNDDFNESTSTVVDRPAADRAADNSLDLIEPGSSHQNNHENENENSSFIRPSSQMSVESSGSDSHSTGSSSTVTTIAGEDQHHHMTSFNGNNNNVSYEDLKKRQQAWFRTILGYWKLAAVSSAWLWLNLLHMGASNFFTPLDILAWLSYVILHLAAPIITACYLWLFAPPGATAGFALSLGLQNMFGVSTHLLFPTAPPWYNHKYGFTPGNYSMPGYAAGLTRVDVALGTHLHSNGFHKSPIVFGAFPSLHSAFVCLIFLYLSRYTSLKLVNRTWLPTIGTFIGFVFVMWQWWATIYLDHHYRLDLLGGATYALLSFILFLPYLKRKETEYVQSHENLDLDSHDMVKTGGMRLFEDTRLEAFFNPLERRLGAVFGGIFGDSQDRFHRANVYSRARANSEVHSFSHSHSQSQSSPYDYYDQHKALELDTLA